MEHIVCKTLDGKSIMISLPSTETIGALKEVLWVKHGVDMKTRDLYYDGQTLISTATIASLRLPHDASLYIGASTEDGTASASHATGSGTTTGTPRSPAKGVLSLSRASSSGSLPGISSPSVGAPRSQGSQKGVQFSGSSTTTSVSQWGQSQWASPVTTPVQQQGAGFFQSPQRALGSPAKRHSTPPRLGELGRANTLNVIPMQQHAPADQGHNSRSNPNSPSNLAAPGGYSWPSPDRTFVSAPGSAPGVRSIAANPFDELQNNTAPASNRPVRDAAETRRLELALQNALKQVENKLNAVLKRAKDVFGAGPESPTGPPMPQLTPELKAQVEGLQSRIARELTRRSEVVDDLKDKSRHHSDVLQRLEKTLKKEEAETAAQVKVVTDEVAALTKRLNTAKVKVDNVKKDRARQLHVAQSELKSLKGSLTQLSSSSDEVLNDMEEHRKKMTNAIANVALRLGLGPDVIAALRSPQRRGSVLSFMSSGSAASAQQMLDAAVDSFVDLSLEAEAAVPAASNSFDEDAEAWEAVGSDKPSAAGIAKKT